MSIENFHNGRRRLLLLTSTAAVTGCGAAEAPRSDAGAAMDVDQPYLGLDGGLANAAADGWSPGAVGVDVGRLAELAVGAWRYNAGARAVVARDERGVFAFSALCTHEGCLVGPPDESGATLCPCHRSRFDGQGRPTMGPATTPLQRHAVRIVGDRVLVDPASRVAVEARAVPPDPDAAAPADAAADSGPVDSGIDPCTLGFDVGEVAAFAPGTWTRLAARSLIVGRDGGGLFAYTARCPHQNCLVEAPVAGTGVCTCNCHGSRFDGNGRVIAGPARADLDHYAVYVCSGRVRVDAEQFVDATERTVVP